RGTACAVAHASRLRTGAVRVRGGSDERARLLLRIRATWAETQRLGVGSAVARRRGGTGAGSRAGAPGGQRRGSVLRLADGHAGIGGGGGARARIGRTGGPDARLLRQLSVRHHGRAG